MGKALGGALLLLAIAPSALAQDREAIAAGNAIYRGKCADCHGEIGRAHV